MFRVIGTEKCENFGINLCQTVLISHKLKQVINDRSSPLPYLANSNDSGDQNVSEDHILPLSLRLSSILLHEQLH